MENIYHDYWQQELMYQFLVEDKCKKKAYVCSPYSAENNEGMLQNMRTARAYMFYALKKMGMCARAPHAFLPMLLCDSVPSERAIALKFGIELLERSDVLLVCGNRISNGMKSEIANAAMLRMPIIVQTIGRIRRMPEARHYGSDLLDSCYLYTFDEKFTAGVKMSLGKGALDACTLFLKNEFKEITLTSEQRTSVTTTRNPQKALLAVAKYAEKHYGVGTNETENKTRLQAAGYVFSDDIVRYTVSGETATLDFSAGDLNAVAVTEKLNTHTHGRDYHNRIGKIGLEIGMEYSYMNTIILYTIENAKSYISIRTYIKFYQKLSKRQELKLQTKNTYRIEKISRF